MARFSPFSNNYGGSSSSGQQQQQQHPRNHQTQSSHGPHQHFQREYQHQHQWQHKSSPQQHQHSNMYRAPSSRHNWQDRQQYQHQHHVTHQQQRGQRMPQEGVYASPQHQGISRQHHQYQYQGHSRQQQQQQSPSSSKSYSSTHSTTNGTISSSPGVSRSSSMIGASSLSATSSSSRFPPSSVVTRNNDHGNYTVKADSDSRLQSHQPTTALGGTTRFGNSTRIPLRDGRSVTDNRGNSSNSSSEHSVMPSVVSTATSLSTTSNHHMAAFSWSLETLERQSAAATEETRRLRELSEPAKDAALMKAHVGLLIASNREALAAHHLDDLIQCNNI